MDDLHLETRMFEDEIIINKLHRKLSSLHTYCTRMGFISDDYLKVFFLPEFNFVNPKLISVLKSQTLIKIEGIKELNFKWVGASPGINYTLKIIRKVCNESKPNLFPETGEFPVEQTVEEIEQVMAESAMKKLVKPEHIPIWLRLFRWLFEDSISIQEILHLIIKYEIPHSRIVEFYEDMKKINTK